jgi:hypothetical protein
VSGAVGLNGFAVGSGAGYLFGCRDSGLGCVTPTENDLLSEEEVRAYLYLRHERGIARGTFKTNHGGIRFLYTRTHDCFA